MVLLLLVVQRSIWKSASALGMALAHAVASVHGDYIFQSDCFDCPAFFKINILLSNIFKLIFLIVLIVARSHRSNRSDWFRSLSSTQTKFDRFDRFDRPHTLDLIVLIGPTFWN